MTVQDDPSLMAAESSNMRIVGHSNLRDAGDTMHVNVRDGIAYVGHMGRSRVGTSVVDVSDPRRPTVLAQLETPLGTHSHKVQVVDDVLAVNYERSQLEGRSSWQSGLATFDISDPARPEPLGFLSMPGKGVHRVTYWEPPYAFVSGSDEGYTDQFLIIVDLGDPTEPKEVARWWVPGMHTAGGETPDWDPSRIYKAHHALVRGDRAYVSWWDAGYFILDVSDISNPRMVTQHFFGGDSVRTHTAMPVPGRDLLLVVEEASDDPAETTRHTHVVDISDEEHPVALSTFPLPAGDHRQRPLRFGPHNLHEPRPGSLIESDTAYLTYFNAGVRVYDISDPVHPLEVGYCVPETPPGQESIQMNDLTVGLDGLIYATDRIGGGLYIMEFDR